MASPTLTYPSLSLFFLPLSFVSFPSPGRADRARPHVGGGPEEVQQEQEPHQEVRQEVRRLPRLGLAHQAGWLMLGV